ncbi:DUF4013 domain-containing protein [Methanobacterium congolense]|uniref:DUF4013 domain-containing protein n=1 Tax=Methanobacterium congolense TaxID=118062 RepID=A0A1D3KZM3_9EURY|nr:DUF4013 domain-containing protein [Methanobacterium congolense]SCG84817.1 putative protein [Methanobacterium congolense]
MKIGEIVKNSIKYPFSDWKKLLMFGIIVMMSSLNYIFESMGVLQSEGITLILLPISCLFGLIFGLFVYGYEIRIFKYSLAGFEELPNFNNGFDLFVDGIKVFVVSIGYILPLILIVVVGGLFLGLTAGIIGHNVVILLGILILVVIFYLIAIFPVFLMALANMAFYDDLGAAFEVHEIFKKISNIGWFNLVKLYIINIIICLVVSIIGALIVSIFDLISLKIIGALFIILIVVPYIEIYIYRSVALFYLSEDQGYLVCEKCGGYYQLQSGESPEDFSDTCECGGKLKFVQDLNDNSAEDTISEKQNFKDKLKSLLNNKWNLAFIGVLILVICLVGFTSTQKAVVTNSTLIGTYNVGDINPVNGTVITAIPSGTSKIRMEYNLSWTQPIAGNSGLTIEGYNVNVTNENLIYQDNSLIYYKVLSLDKNDKNKTGTLYLDGSSIKCLVISQAGVNGTIKIYSEKTA